MPTDDSMMTEGKTEKQSEIINQYDNSILYTDHIVTEVIKIAKETGIYEWERYIDVTAQPGWEQIALDWILNAVDPDHSKKKIVSISGDPA